MCTSGQRIFKLGAAFRISGYCPNDFSQRKESPMLTLKHRVSSTRGCPVNSNRHWLIAVIACLAALMLSPAAMAQSVTGSISGIVTDPNGAIVAGANVTLIGEQTGDKRDQVTNDSGRFSFSAVQPGPQRQRGAGAG